MPRRSTIARPLDAGSPHVARGGAAASRPGPPLPALPALVAALLWIAGPAAGPAHAQQGMEDVEVTATHVAGSVYMIEGRGGNIGVSLGEDGVLLVDDQFDELAPRIRATVDSLAGSEAAGEVDYVLNTHWHPDHTDGNRAFGPDAPVLSHHNVRRRLSTPQTAGGDTTPPLPDDALPDITFGEGVSIHLNGEEIRVEHFPRGHTDGDAVLFFTGSDVVHMGDHMFAGRFPFVDLGSGGTVQGYTRNVKAVLDTLPADAAVIPGHGPLTDVQGLREFHRMLVETTGIVRRRMEQGMSLEEVRAEGLGPEWESWGQGFISTDQWLATVYRSLSREGAGAGSGGGAGPRASVWHPHGHDGHGPGHDHDHGGDGP